MPSQYDVQSGLDLSSLASATLAQIQQSISQLAPLANIGGILCFDGVALGAAGEGFPDVTNNPRFVRYIWLDTNPGGTAVVDRSNPVFKRYVGAYTGGPSNPSALSNTYGDWQAQGVADGSITTAMLRLRDATGGVNVDLMKRAADGSADVSFQYRVLRIDAAGQYVESVTIDNAIADGGGIKLNRLVTTGLAVGKYLGYSGGILAYRYINPSTDLVNFGGGNDSRILVGTSIAPGTAKYLLRTDSTGTNPEWVATNAADLFASGDITLPKLASGGAVALDILRYDGTNWVKATPAINIVAGIQSSDGAAIAINTAQAFVLGGRPKYLRFVIFKFQNADEQGYTIGDEIEIAGTSIHSNIGTGIANASASSTGAQIQFFNSAPFVFHKTTAADGAITIGNWKPRIYYLL